MKNKTQLPKWFDGTIYDKGDTVTNPFSGDTYELNNLELSMYDLTLSQISDISVYCDIKTYNLSAQDIMYGNSIINK